MTENIYWCIYVTITLLVFYSVSILPLRKQVSWEDFMIASLASYSLAATLCLAKFLVSEVLK